MQWRTCSFSRYIKPSRVVHVKYLPYGCLALDCSFSFRSRESPSRCVPPKPSVGGISLLVRCVRRPVSPPPGLRVAWARSQNQHQQTRDSAESSRSSSPPNKARPRPSPSKVSTKKESRREKHQHLNDGRQQHRC